MEGESGTGIDRAGTYGWAESDGYSGRQASLQTGLTFSFMGGRSTRAVLRAGMCICLGTFARGIPREIHI